MDITKINEMIRMNLKTDNHNFSILSEYGFREFLSLLYHQIQLGKKHHIISFDTDPLFQNLRGKYIKERLYTIGWDNKTIDKVMRGYKGEVSDEIKELILSKFDEWCYSQWTKSPVIKNWKSSRIYKNGNPDNSNAFRSMRNKTRLKEFYMYRYKSHVVILTNSSDVLKRLKFAVEDWFSHMYGIDFDLKCQDLKKEKVRVAGYDIKVIYRNKKYIVKSSIPEKRLEEIGNELKWKLKKAIRYNQPYSYSHYLEEYNRLVFNIHSYFKYATNVSLDLRNLNFKMNNLINREIKKRSSNISRHIEGAVIPEMYRGYLKSEMVRYLRSTKQIILPIGYIKFQKPFFRKK